MKYFSWFTVLFCTTLLASPTIVKELEDAYAESQNTKQKIIAVFGADWCGACKKLHQTLMDNPKIIDNYIYVYIDIEDRKDLKKEYAVGRIPDIMILDKNIEVKRRVGFKNLKEFTEWLEK
ncbi:MAG: thioredoxin [Chitinophagia bacterium]|nr:thioredoxin [Chitinophagia bacterium]